MAGTLIFQFFCVFHSLNFAQTFRKFNCLAHDARLNVIFHLRGEQEVTIDGQDKVFKDVIEPLESVSVNLIPTSKENIRDFGSPQQVSNKTLG